MIIRGTSFPKECAKSAAEQDVVTPWRKLYCYTKRAGVTASIKRQIRRRQRHDKSWKND
jgi:hypothetical protein